MQFKKLNIVLHYYNINYSLQLNLIEPLYHDELWQGIAFATGLHNVQSNLITKENVLLCSYSLETATPN